MAFSIREKTERTLSEINVVPLVDVMLVMLVIFMITAPMIQRGVDVAVPKTKTGNVIPEERLIITITREDHIYTTGSDQRVGVQDVRDVIDRWYADKPVATEDRTIYVRADGEVPYSTLMRVIDEAKLAGIRAVGLVTDPQGAEEEREGKKDS